MVNHINEYHKLMDKYPRRFGQEIHLARKRVEDIYLIKYDYKSNMVNFYINWLESNVHIPVEGGKPQLLKLTPMQKYLIGIIFGFYGNVSKKEVDENGNIIENVAYQRIIKDITMVIGSGSGKSTLLAGIAMLIQEMGIFGNPDVYIGSNAYTTSKQLFDKIKSMIDYAMTDTNYQIQSSVGTISNNTFNGKIKAMSSKGDTYEGIEPYMLIIDEVHLFKTPEYVNNLKKNATKRPDMFTFEITTQGFERGGYLDRRIEYLRQLNRQEVQNDREFAFIFENESEDEVIDAYYNEDYDIYYKSNPNAGYSQSLDAIHSSILDMMNDPSKKGVTFTKNFNIPQTKTNIYFSTKECESISFDESILYGKPCFLGLDVAWTRTPESDLSSFTIRVHDLYTDNIYKKDYYFLPKYWKQDDEKLVDMIGPKSQHDGIDYDYFIARNDIIVVDSWEITEDYLINFMIEKVVEFNLKPLKFGLDPNKAENIKLLFNANMEDKMFCLDYRSEKKVINTPMIEGMKEERNSKKVFTNNKLTEIHLSNTEVNEDNNGYKIFVNSSGTQKDGTISEVAAKSAEFVFYARNPLIYQEHLEQWQNEAHIL